MYGLDVADLNSTIVEIREHGYRPEVLYMGPVVYDAIQLQMAKEHATWGWNHMGFFNRLALQFLGFDYWTWYLSFQQEYRNVNILVAGV